MYALSLHGKCGRHVIFLSLQWRHNESDRVSNHQPHDCLIKRLFGSRSKKTSKPRATGLCVGNSPGPVNSPHKGPVTRKIFPFDDVIMVLPLGIYHKLITAFVTQHRYLPICHFLYIVDLTSVRAGLKCNNFHSKEWSWKYRLQNNRHFVIQLPVLHSQRWV